VDKQKKVLQGTNVTAGMVVLFIVQCTNTINFKS